MTELKIKKINGAVVFATKIIPGSSKTALAGMLDGILKIRISAPPEKGKANESLLKFLAKQLGVKKKSVSIISGLRKSIKQIKVLDISIETLQNKLDMRS